MVTGARGAQVVNLDRVRLKHLARLLEPSLVSGRTVFIEADLQDAPERWRRAARLAGRINGWRVRTGLLPGGRVWAVRIDGSRHMDEQLTAARLAYLGATLDHGLGTSSLAT